MKGSFRLALAVAALLSASRAHAAAAGDVIISEIAWAGSQASVNDEWVEFFNTTGSAIDMGGWRLLETNNGTTLTNVTAGFPLPANTTIPAGGFMLVVSRNGTAVQAACTVAATCTKISITAFSSNLANGGEQLQLQDNNMVPIDTAGLPTTAWFAGVNSAAGSQKKSMERNSPLCGLPDGTVAGSWHTNDGSAVNGQDSGANALIATPGAPNSQWTSLPICSVALSGSLAAADGVDTLLVTAAIGGLPDSAAVNLRPVGGSYAAAAMTQGAGNTWTFAWTSPVSGAFEYYVTGTKGAVTSPASPPTTPDFVGFYDLGGPACIGPARSVDVNGVITNDQVPVLVGGVVTSPNPAFNTFAPVGSGNQFYVEDACPSPAAINVFSSGGTTRLAATQADQVVVLGRVSQFQGLTEIAPKAAHTYSSGNPVAPTLMTLAQIAAAPPESLEARLIEVRGLSITAGAWPAAGADGTLTVTDDAGVTSFTLLVDRDTDVDGTAAPGSPIRLVAILSQLDPASPLLDGYELLPRTSADVNAAPVITGPGNQAVNENSPLSFVATATDREGDAITWSATGLPAGANFDPATQTFTWTPTFSQSGIYSVTLRAADAFQTGTKTITITVGNTDRAPVLAALADQNGMEGVPLTFTVSATDADNDVLTYTMAPTPAGATLDPSTGVFSWTPAFLQAGIYMVTFKATDPSALFDSKQISINIAPEPRDLSVVPDLTPPPDLTAAPPDLTAPRDLTVPRDLTAAPPDLTVRHDLALSGGDGGDGGEIGDGGPVVEDGGASDAGAADAGRRSDLGHSDLAIGPHTTTNASGCGCRVAGHETAPGWPALFGVGLALVLLRRRLRRAAR